MRPNFNILWVDDQDTSDDENSLSLKLADEGFRLKVKQARNLEELDELIDGNLYGDNIDLIIIDYDLGGSDLGIDGAQKVRDKWPYKELIFYSAQQPGDLIEFIKQRNFQFVACCDKADIEQTTTDVFENMTRRQLDLSHSRGIIIELACDIDSLIWQTVKGLTVKGYDKNNRFICAMSDAIDKVSNAGKRETAKTALVSSHLSESNFDEFVTVIFEKNIFIKSSKILEILRNILKDMDERAKSSKIEMFKVKCLKERNLLAHGRVKYLENFQTQLFRHDGSEITMDQMKILRCKGIEQLDYFEGLLEWCQGLSKKN